MRSTKLSKSEKPTTLCATDNRLLMAVGFVDGCIALYKGDLSRDRSSKPKMLKELGQEITGMAFSSVIKNQWHLFVSTASSVQQFNVTSKDSCPMVFIHYSSFYCGINYSIILKCFVILISDRFGCSRM